MTTETDEQAALLLWNNLFHRLWTKAVGTADYDKKEWMELEHRLLAWEREKQEPVVRESTQWLSDALVSIAATLHDLGMDLNAAHVAYASIKLRDPTPPVAQDGMMKVPREPTDDMLRAGWNAYLRDMKGGLERFDITYRAMLSAAPASQDAPVVSATESIRKKFSRQLDRILSEANAAAQNSLSEAQGTRDGNSPEISPPVPATPQVTINGDDREATIDDALRGKEEA